MERRLSQWSQGFADKAERFHAVRVQVEPVRATESSADGAVRVTVDSTGALTDLAFTDRIRDMPPPEVATAVMTCLRRAQQQLAPLVRKAMQATVADEQRLVEGMVSNYQERFGESPPSSAADPGVLGVGAIEDDTVVEERPPHRSHRGGCAARLRLRTTSTSLTGTTRARGGDHGRAVRGAHRGAAGARQEC